MGDAMAYFLGLENMDGEIAGENQWEKIGNIMNIKKNKKKICFVLVDGCE